MLRSQKAQYVSDIESIYRQHECVLLVHYHGLSVVKVNNLRNDLYGIHGKFKVIKNTLAKIAGRSVEFSDKTLAAFKGPVAIAYANDPIGLSKALVKFAKDNTNMEILGGVIEGKFVDANGIKAIASLPPADQIKGNLISVLQAPAANIIRILQAPAGNLVRVLDGRSKQ